LKHADKNKDKLVGGDCRPLLPK